MTLIELLVGLVITGFALAFAYGALSAAIDHRARVSDATVALEESVRVRRTLASWIGGARLSIDLAGPDYRGIDAIDGADDDDELRFLTQAPTFLGTRSTVVKLYVDRDPKSPERGLVAELAEWRGPRTERVELEPSVTGLDIRYLSSVLEKESWTTSWISTSILPAAVELRLVASDPEAIPPVLRLPVVVPLGAIR